MSGDTSPRRIGFSNTVLQNEPRSIAWLWEGVVARGAITLLSAPEKVGKTTLLSLLLDRRRAGGQLLGRPVQPGRTILCSEEENQLWALRQPPLDFGPDLRFYRPFCDVPSRRRWRHFIDDLISCVDTDNHFDLLVIDTAMSFIPHVERNRRTLRWALGQLTYVVDFPAGVLILNQSRTVHRPLAAFADIVIEMAVPRLHAPASPRGCANGAAMTLRSTSTTSAACTRRRLFTGVGRYPGTLQGVTAELNADGTDYTLVEPDPAPQPTLLPTVQALLAASPTPLTRQELLARWPGAPPRPDTLWRTLTQGADRGLLTISGTGTRNDALRYAAVTQSDAAEIADEGTRGGSGL